MTELYIGLMSGTSLDGADGVLVDFSSFNANQTVQVLAHCHVSFAPQLTAELLALNTVADNELHRAALAGNALARVYADVVESLLRSCEASRDAVLAIGAHGQTVRHRPGDFDGTGYSLQLNNPALLAELCGINVVADFRARDIAAAGQGAPLVCAFHRALFGASALNVGVLNLGGISNLTALLSSGQTLGLDCGPGNLLMNAWCIEHTGDAFDEGGQWAASGQVVPVLLQSMLNDAYFERPAPKSTGRDRFNTKWLRKHLECAGTAASAPVNVQATLAELTAACCANALLQYVPNAHELLVCGGGAFNHHVMQRLSARLPTVPVRATDECGLPAVQVEACAFAWLARAFQLREPGNLSDVTGAKGPRVLGALYPA
jgi:anhydro-N-acetylmuramic acid kinase